MYYDDKLTTLKQLFGTQEVFLEERALLVRERRFPIVGDVIILSDPSRYSSRIRKAMSAPVPATTSPAGFAEDIQYSFGEEWQTYGQILPEHDKEFALYFDLVDLKSLADKRVFDLGCGSGRWSYFLRHRVRELVLVDFSDAIFVARRNLADSNRALFFHGDLKQLPFVDDTADLVYSLGVLHHLPTPCLDEVRKLKRLAPRLLIFLYYALDNRPLHFQALLKAVTLVRLGLSKIRQPRVREGIAWAGALGLYWPMIMLGRLVKPFGLAKQVPLYEFYHDKSLGRIEQDVYDRFFTRIEQRVSRADIQTLRDTFSKITISPHLPYWHFLCER